LGAGLAVVLLAMAIRADSAETARVTGVLSGNRIRLEDGRTVKYIGVGIPTHPFAGRTAQELKRLSTDFNRSLVDRATIRLVFDTRRRDRQGNLLAYVYSGNRFINAEIIENGYALVETDPANSRYTEYFKKLLRRARRRQAGFWKPPEGPTAGPTPISPLRPAGKIVFTQAGDPYYYPPRDPRLKPGARPRLLEDALRAGLKACPPRSKAKN